MSDCVKDEEEEDLICYCSRSARVEPISSEKDEKECSYIKSHFSFLFPHRLDASEFVTGRSVGRSVGRQEDEGEQEQ